MTFMIGAVKVVGGEGKYYDEVSGQECWFWKEREMPLPDEATTQPRNQWKIVWM